MPLNKKEQDTLKHIVVHSQNDPNNPEFPADNPKFPATPTYQIHIPGFNNLWIKDESHNPTGTHKDRLAWEIIVYYKKFLEQKRLDKTNQDLPHMSIVSSGSAAFAIQTALLRYQLPSLKVIIDSKYINSIISKALLQVGCELYPYDLSEKTLYWKDILEITHNTNGFDITSGKALNPTTQFYDWLSYEIINESPDYCFIPFGTGNLYENILNIVRKEIDADIPDPRFRSTKKQIASCQYIGATTTNPISKATKLYAPHLPFSDFDEQWIRFYKSTGYCGMLSEVYSITETYLDAALRIAREHNITCEPSGIAGLALLLQMKETIDTDKKILIVNTGKSSYLD